MTLADRFRISDNLYKINKIVTNFENNQSSLELINTNNTSGDLIIVDTVVKPKYDNTFKCITADTDIYTADNIILKADFACGDLSDGKILSNPKDNQSDDLLLPNSPDPLNSINDVIVTAPTVKRISNDITGSSIKFTYEVSTLGLIDSSPNLAEYGFLIASDLTLLAGTDVDVIKATAGVEVIEYLTNAFTNRPSLPHLAYATKDNLTANTDYYYRFYARTNLNTTYAKADTLSELETVNITTYCQGDFYRYIGFQVGDKATVFTYLTVDGVKSSSVGIYAQGSFSECICLESITSTEAFEFFDPYNNQEKCT
jgi:hypothetical protein